MTIARSIIFFVFDKNTAADGVAAINEKKNRYH
jgi:hypothetical protein